MTVCLYDKIDREEALASAKACSYHPTTNAKAVLAHKHEHRVEALLPRELYYADMERCFYI